MLDDEGEEDDDKKDPNQGSFVMSPLRDKFVLTVLITPFAVFLQKISIHLCPNLFQYVCIFFPRTASRRSQFCRQIYGELEKLTERLLAKLHPPNLVNTMFYLMF